MHRVTMRMIARELGVSIMTVSLALRDRPGVSGGVRLAVRDAARRMGYKPDPVAAELMAQVRAQRRARGAEVIAFLNTFRDPSFMRRYPTFRAFLSGAQHNAEECGYRLEEFALHERNITPARLAHILHSRGIRGIMVGPRWLDEPCVDFDWQPFCSVVVGESVYQPNLHRVCNDHTHTMLTTLRHLWQLGYRRIAVYLTNAYESVREYDLLMGVEVFRREHPDPGNCTVWLEPDWNEARFAQLWHDAQPDAVVSLATNPGEWLENHSTWDRCGFACLDLYPEHTWSGIDQLSREVGMAAMDQLRLLLQRGARGLQKRAQLVLVEGTWVHGTSTPPRQVADQT